MNEVETPLVSCGVAVINGHGKFTSLSSGFRRVVGCSDDSVDELAKLFGNVSAVVDWLNAALKEGKQSSFHHDSLTIQFLPFNDQLQTSPNTDTIENTD